MKSSPGSSLTPALCAYLQVQDLLPSEGVREVMMSRSLHSEKAPSLCAIPHFGTFWWALFMLALPCLAFYFLLSEREGACNDNTAHTWIVSFLSDNITLTPTSTTVCELCIYILIGNFTYWDCVFVFVLGEWSAFGFIQVELTGCSNFWSGGWGSFLWGSGLPLISQSSLYLSSHHLLASSFPLPQWKY